MNRYTRLWLCLFASVSFSLSARSQICLGAGAGTFHVPGDQDPWRVFGPTVRAEYYDPQNSRFAPYLDLSYFKREEGETFTFNYTGVPTIIETIGYKYSFIYSQLGCKYLLVDPSAIRVIPYIGAGGAFTYETVEAIPPGGSSETSGVFRYGAHTSAGVEYDAGILVVELRGDLDYFIKPLTDGTSNVLTNVRLSVTFPLTSSD